MAYRPEWESGGEYRGGLGGPGWTATKVLLVSFGVVFLISLLGQSLPQVVVTATQPDGSEFELTRRNPILHFLTLRLDNFYWVYPLVSYAFVHDLGDLMHLLFNCLVIYFFGNDLEASLGKRRFLGLFFGSVVVGAVVHMVAQSFAYGGGYQMLLGASGGALGLLFYAAWATPNRTVIFWFIPLRMRTLAYIFLALNVYPVLMRAGGNVAYFCHLGGALFGYLFWKFSWDPLAWFSQAKEVLDHQVETRRVEQTQASDAEMDRILKKISEEGLPSLTKAERKFLDDRSKSMRKDDR